MATKIKHLKLANAVKCGSDTETMFSDPKYSIELDGIIIVITDSKSGRNSKTTLMNTIWWMDEDAPEEKAAPAKAGKPTGKVVL